MASSEHVIDCFETEEFLYCILQNVLLLLFDNVYNILQRKVDFLQEQLTERNGEVIKLHGSLTKRGLLPPLPSADTTYTTCTDKLDRLGQLLTRNVFCFDVC